MFEGVKVTITTHIVRRCGDCPHMTMEWSGAFCNRGISQTEVDTMPMWCPLLEVAYDKKKRKIHTPDGLKYTIDKDALVDPERKRWGHDSE